MTLVEREFRKMVEQRKGHVKMKMKRVQKGQFALRMRRGIPVKESTMRKYLQRAGIRVDDTGYSQADLIDAIKFAIGKNKFARELGAEYLFEQWKLKS